MAENRLAGGGVRTLRFFVDEDSGPAGVHQWALYEDGDRLSNEGKSPPHLWPAADRVQGIVAAPLARLMRVKLPKMAMAQLSSALAYALEDQLVGDPESHHIGQGARAEDGSMLVAVADKALLNTVIQSAAQSGLSVDRLAVEPCLPPRGPGEWIWVDFVRGGFVVTGDGRSLTVDSIDGDIPATLTLALQAHADQGEGAPTLRWYASAERHAKLGTLVESYGIHIVREAPWNWRNATDDSIQSSINLLHGEFRVGPGKASSNSIKGLRRALWLVAAALLVHVLATSMEWAALEWRARKIQNEMRSTYATSFRAPPPAGAVEADFARLFAQAAHARGALAPNDALPLLARAAPVLREVGIPEWRTLAYSESSLTLELPRISASLAQSLQSALLRVGVNCAVADFDGGSRIRLQAVL